MIYKFNILNEVDVHEWDNNLLKSDYSTFFQSAKFLKIQTKGRKSLFITVTDSNKKVMGQLGLSIIEIHTTYSTRKIEKFLNVCL